MAIDAPPIAYPQPMPSGMPREHTRGCVNLPDGTWRVTELGVIDTELAGRLAPDDPMTEARTGVILTEESWIARSVSCDMTNWRLRSGEVLLGKSTCGVPQALGDTADKLNLTSVWARA
eukprot:1638110-Amphidinium_carterae.1